MSVPLRHSHGVGCATAPVPRRNKKALARIVCFNPILDVGVNRCVINHTQTGVKALLWVGGGQFGACTAISWSPMKPVTAYTHGCPHACHASEYNLQGSPPAVVQLDQWPERSRQIMWLGARGAENSPPLVSSAEDALQGLHEHLGQVRQMY